MPEFVLIPAPVTTTTFFALTRALAMTWRAPPSSGRTWAVGMAGEDCVDYQKGDFKGKKMQRSKKKSK